MQSRARSTFQSQTRSRPGCHPTVSPSSSAVLPVSISNEKPPRLPLHRTDKDSVIEATVSISNEKPPQLPRQIDRDKHIARRHVSISNEKPPRLPRRYRVCSRVRDLRFNLKREAAPVATLRYPLRAAPCCPFQSQTRSRPGCHSIGRIRIL